jgi:hypothetical protein
VIHSRRSEGDTCVDRSSTSGENTLGESECAGVEPPEALNSRSES